MEGRRLNRIAVACSTAARNIIAVADQPRTSPFMPSARIIPTIDAIPTITVIAISVEEKVPETIRAQPSKNSQIAVINRSQNKKHGSATHLLQPERRMLRTMAIQSGDVCTMCRMTPWDTAPTTSKAAIMDTQQAVKIRKSRFKGCYPMPRKSCLEAFQFVVVLQSAATATNAIPKTT
jgi:hypothetical protein